MTDPTQARRPVPRPAQTVSPYGQGSSANLADILERVLDKGIVIAGDIQINLLDIELLTIKLRLLVASVDKAKEMGIDWWEHDPSLSSRAREDSGRPSLAEENRRLRAEVENLRGRSLAPADSPASVVDEEAVRREESERHQGTRRRGSDDR
ncbi:gas vesicle protein [Streptomyces sp. MnatMP-M17]|uniref:gas vesicle protein n=1 Tax=unclassified Streptomyces TaxID=2593676 RepID=UPI00081E6721|nr:gas vesicle protein [Streptomyces sp. MnatMP-M17]MYZ35839.1 gas vesicle protein [Streptomyces sp. SID4917]SCF78759.1 Gas vesicle protein [Streptomyces sp. MnatMP-M17]